MMEENIHKNILINLEQEPIIFDYINNGITITDKNSSIIYTNPTFTKITGYSKEEAKGENPGILRPPDLDHILFYQEATENHL